MASRLSFLLLINCFVTSLFAQELNCTVQVNTQQISGTDKMVYDRFQNAVEAYMNSTKFSDIAYNDQEKINCSLLFVFKKREGNKHSCEMQIKSSRPIYGSSYTTSLLSFKENCTFEFEERKTLTFQQNTVDDELTATLNFWAYVMLGLDFDSFELYAGDLYFQKAKDLVQMAQSFGDNWKSQQDKNHWGWTNALTNENQKPMRTLSYKYHREGLDSMHLKVDLGRIKIMQSIQLIGAVKRNQPNSPLLSNFIETKVDELTKIYAAASEEEANQVMVLLQGLFPSYSNKLQSIKTRP